jgi:hypothetical protein
LTNQVPSVWASFRESLSVEKVFEVLTGKNAQFSALVAERQIHLSSHFVSDGQSESPRVFLSSMLLANYSRLLASRRHECRSVFVLLCSLLRMSPANEGKSAAMMKGLFADILRIEPKDDAAEPDEYLAGIMSLCAELMKGLPQYRGSHEEEKLFALLLDRFLYAPLGADGNPTALARSQHLRQACFDLIGALVSSGALGADGLDRGLNALGTQYMESPAVREWKEVAAMDGDDADRATKTSKFMGLRNMACT